KLLFQAAGLEEKLPIAFGPLSIDKPTHELLGQFLLRHGRTSEARVQLENALAGAPGRRVATQGLLAASAGLPPIFAAAARRGDEQVTSVPDDDPICGLPARH